MKIGIMCHASFGGSARMATELALALAQREHHIHLFSLSAPFDAWSDTNQITLHQVIPARRPGHHPATLYTDWSAWELQALLHQIEEVITKDGLDILHFHYADPFALVAAALKQRLGSKAPCIVGTFHGTDVLIQGRNPYKGSQLRQALQYADHLTAVSTSLAELASNIFNLPSYPQVIPNFVDLSRFKPPHTNEQSNSKMAGQGRKPIIVHISNFRPVKDPLNMAHIFLGIRAQIDAELWVIGDGQGMDQVRATLRQGEVEQDVRYRGLQPNIVPLLAQADLLLMTSQYESFCLVALEAMACGVPVLATDVGGLPEVVQSEKTGYLFPRDNQAIAVTWAVQLLSDPDRYWVMQRSAITQARRFGTEQVVPVYEALYDRLLANRPIAVDPHFFLPHPSEIPSMIWGQ